MGTLPNTVFVTGASAGFGAAIVRRFVARGARAITAARRAERLEALASELGERVLPIVLDVRERAAVESAIAALPGDFAQVDCLVNADLALATEPAQRASVDAWDRMTDANCKGLRGR